MKKLLLLFLFLACGLAVTYAQPRVSFRVSVYDNLGNPYLGYVPFSIRNSDSTSYPTGLRSIHQSWHPAKQTDHVLFDTMRTDSIYAGNLVTINYYACGQWRKFDTIFTRTPAQNLINIQLTCLSPCGFGGFNYSDYNGRVSFTALSNYPYYKHTWFFGDSTSDTGRTVVHQYPQTGLYYVVHRLTHTISSCVLYDTVPIQVYVGCGSDFTWQVDSTGYNVDFTSSSSDSTYSAIWTFGDNTNSSLHSPSKTYTQRGTYLVTLLVMNGVKKCVDTIRKNVFVPGNCDVNFSYYTNDLDAYFTNTSFDPSGRNYLWIFGDGDTLLSDSTYVNHTYADSGDYQVMLIVSDSLGCRDTVVKYVRINGSCDAFFMENRLTLRTVLLHNYSTGTDKSSFWDFGDGDTLTSDTSTLQHTYNDTGTFRIRLILTTAHCRDTFETWFSVYDSCGSGFYVNDTNYRNVLIHNNIYPYSGTEVFWDFGDGTYAYNDSMYFEHIYADTGTYTIRQVVRGIYCVDSFERVIFVRDFCSAIFTNTQTGPKITVNFSYNTPGTAHFWDFGDGHTSTAAQPSHVYTATGTYLVVHTVNSLTCFDSTAKSIVVTKLCGGTWQPNISGYYVLLNYSGAYPVPDSIHLDFGDGNVYDSIRPYHMYTMNGTYKVRLITYNAGCIDTLEYTAVITGSCNATFTFSRSGNNVYFNSNGSVGTTRSWNFGDGNTSTSSNPNHYYSSPGTYSVRLIVSSNNCKDTIIKSVVIPVPCNANFRVEGQNDQYTYNFYPLDSNATNIRWIFNGTDTSTANPGIKTFAGEGYQYITMQVLDSNGNVLCTGYNYVYSNICGNLVNQPVIGYLTFNDTFRIDYDSVMVYLIAYDSVAGTLSALDSTILYNHDSAYYHFSVCDTPQVMLVKAACMPGSKYYSSYLPTYSHSSTLWSGAAFVYPGWTYYEINMVQGVNPGGPGFIGGYISMGANKSGGMLEGVQVNLYTDAGVPVTSTYTNAGGRYEFAGIALGKYKVLVEIPGKGSDVHYVTLTSDRQSADELNFEVNKKDITILSSVRSLLPSEYKLYPVPADKTLNLELANQEETQWQITIMDIQGRFIPVNVLNTGDVNSYRMDISSLPQGVYVIRLVSGSTITNLQFIKQ